MPNRSAWKGVSNTRASLSAAASSQQSLDRSECESDPRQAWRAVAAGDMTQGDGGFPRRLKSNSKSDRCVFGPGRKSRLEFQGELAGAVWSLSLPRPYFLTL